jgi:hypothetical protein
LPQFPDECKYVINNSLFIRDVLCCNKNTEYNPHINWGGQYDPHYEYEVGPQFKMCHKNQRNKIKELADSKLYDKIFIVFRTTKTYLKGFRRSYISGVFEIDQNNIRLDYDYEDYVLYAKDCILLTENDALDISDYLKKYNLYISRFNSLTNEGIHNKYFLNIISHVGKKNNYIDKYIKETQKLENIFHYFEFEEGYYEKCIKCNSKNICPLIKRINKVGKLCDRLPNKITNIIREHYKSNLDMEAD